jgi:hypothetical protein
MWSACLGTCGGACNWDDDEAKENMDHKVCLFFRSFLIPYVFFFFGVHLQYSLLRSVVAALVFRFVFGPHFFAVLVAYRR